MKKLLSLATALVSMNAMAHRTDSNTPNLRDVEVKHFDINGTGCPSGDGAFIYFGGGAIIVDAEEMVAIFGEGYTPRDSRKICQYNITLDVPNGWTYGVKAISAGTLNYMTADAKTQTKFTAHFNLKDGMGEAEMNINSDGFEDPDFYLPMDEVQYAPCGEGESTLKIKQSLRAIGQRRNPNSFAITTLSGPTAFLLKWKKC